MSTSADTPHLDLLVVGSGVAGLSAAVRAAEHGLSVGVLTKGMLEQATTRWAQGGIAAVVGGDPDSTDIHLADTLAAGVGLCDETAVRVLVDEGPKRVMELIALGAVFDRDEAGALALAREGGHSAARVVHAGGAATGVEVERAPRQHDGRLRLSGLAGVLKRLGIAQSARSGAWGVVPEEGDDLCIRGRSEIVLVPLAQVVEPGPVPMRLEKCQHLRARAPARPQAQPFDVGVRHRPVAFRETARPGPVAIPHRIQRRGQRARLHLRNRAFRRAHDRTRRTRHQGQTQTKDQPAPPQDYLHFFCRTRIDTERH